MNLPLFADMGRMNGRCLLAERLGCSAGPVAAAVLYTLIQTVRVNDVDPQSWLADILGRIADQAASRLDELLPWNWQAQRTAIAD